MEKKKRKYGSPSLLRLMPCEQPRLMYTIPHAPKRPSLFRALLGDILIMVLFSESPCRWPPKQLCKFHDDLGGAGRITSQALPKQTPPLCRAILLTSTRTLRPPTLPAVPSPPSAENDRPQTDLASVLRLCLCALGVRRGQPRSTCSTCAALPSSVNSACRCRAIPVPGGRTTVANCRDEPTTTTPTVTRCVEIAAPSSFHLAHRPPLRVPGGMRAGRWFKLLSAPGKVGLKIMSRATGL